MTTSNESTAPIIPNFEADAHTLAAFDEAWTQYQTRVLSEAEEKTRATFARDRAVIRAEIALAGSELIDRRFKADQALKTYAFRYPHRIENNQPQPPSFWEQVFSIGTAGWMFRRTTVTATNVREALIERRRKEAEEVELEQRLQRDLTTQDEELRKSFHTDEGVAAFHAQPGMAELHQHVEAIEAERADYAARLADGNVAATEQRDRDFAQHKIKALEIPCAGVTIVRVARYGELTYYVLRDLKSHLFQLAYDPRLEFLIDVVFEVYRVGEAHHVRLVPGVGGLPMSLADHYAANFPDQAEARSQLRKHRTALQGPRTGIPPMDFHLSLDDDTNEQDLIELLAVFAQTFAPESAANQDGTAAALHADAIAAALDAAFAVPAEPPPEA